MDGLLVLIISVSFAIFGLCLYIYRTGYQNGYEARENLEEKNGRTQHNDSSSIRG